MNIRKNSTVWKTFFRLAFLLMLVALPDASPVSGLGDGDYQVWLPFVRKAPSNPVYTGIASFYPANGSGNCQYVPPAPEDLMVAAINSYQYDHSRICGAYVNVKGPRGSVIVRIVDFCPSCGNYQLDLSYEAFDKIGYRARGYADITWQIVSPDLSGPIGYHFLEGTNQWWPALNIRNSRNPIDKIEYYNASGNWVNIPRSELNWFVEDRPKMGPGPYTFRVTDVYGNVLIDRNIKLVPSSVQPGARQFPPGP